MKRPCSSVGGYGSRSGEKPEVDVAGAALAIRASPVRTTRNGLALKPGLNQLGWLQNPNRLLGLWRGGVGGKRGGLRSRSVTPGTARLPGVSARAAPIPDATRAT